MLTSYLNTTKLLLQNPAAPVGLYSDANLTAFINTGRAQLAGEAECCRYLATFTTTIANRVYFYSGLNTGTASVSGLSGALNVRALRYAVGDGYQWIRPRSWPWFDFYKMNNPVPGSGAPEVWAQFGQGGAGAGSITGVGGGSMTPGNLFLDPIPDLAYVITADCTCYPQTLAADADVEAIPYMFTEAVPYYAAYLALLSAQNNARMADAQRYFEMYKMFVDRARHAANPSVNRYLYEQSQDPSQINKLGIQKSVGGGA